MNQTLRALLRASATRWLGLAICLFLLSACDRTDEAPRTQDLDPKALLELRFLTPGQTAEVDLTSVGHGDVERKNVEPLQAVQLDETHAVLLTRVRTGEDCHACPGVMGAYFFENDGKGWRLTKSHDGLLATGVRDEIGTVKVTPLQDKLHAATIEGGSCWQGTCAGWMEVVTLRPDAAQPLGSVPVYINNDAAYGACTALDQPKTERPKEAEPEEELQPHQQVCQDIDSKWQFQGLRLVVDFTGRLLEVKDETLQPLRKIAQRTVYELQADNLKLVEGENPIPGF